MNPWQILEVAQTADARAIKRAYAKKLKVTKPDEKPTEFQALHEAYKLALNVANNQSAQTRKREQELVQQQEDPAQQAPSETITIALRTNDIPDKGCDVLACAPDASPIETIEATVSNSAETTNETPTYQSEQNDAYLQHQKQLRYEEYQKLVAVVKNLLEDSRGMNDETRWQFLTYSTYLLEEEFNWYLGREVFRLLGEYSQTRVRRARGRYYNREVPGHIVQYCSQLFSWKNVAQYLEKEFGREFCNSLLVQLEENHNFSSPGQGLRGGTLVRSEESPKARPTQKATSSSNINIGAILFLLFVLAKLAQFFQSSLNN